MFGPQSAAAASHKCETADLPHINHNFPCVTQMKLVSLFTFAVACASVAAKLHAFQRSRRIASIAEFTPRVGRKQIGFLHGLASQSIRHYMCEEVRRCLVEIAETRSACPNIGDHHALKQLIANTTVSQLHCVLATGAYEMAEPDNGIPNVRLYCAWQKQLFICRPKLTLTNTCCA
jgi:hypothetical protein